MHVNQTFTFVFEGPSTLEPDSPIADFEATYRVASGASAEANCPPQAPSIEILEIRRFSGEDMVPVEKPHEERLAKQLCENPGILLEIALEIADGATLDAGR